MVDLVAHDLANGLATARLCVGAFCEQAACPAPSFREYASLLRQSIQDLEHLVADLRDTRDMASGRFVVDPSPFVSPLSLVSNACAAARVRQRTLVTACEPELAPVLADERQIQRVFANLIGNAVKFTEPALAITVGARRAPDPDHVSFFVHDDGPGIPPADQARVFEPYWQAGHQHRRGSGLGLTICRGIVEAHGGHIDVTSRPGSGSTFAFTLPCADGPRR